MTEPVLVLPVGLGWPVIKSPRFSTRVQRAVNGRMLAVQDQLFPIWSFTLTIELLRDPNDRRGNALFPQELRTLMDFYNARRGRSDTFLYEDPSDNDVTGQFLDQGTGSRSQFQLYRTMAEFVEPVTAPKIVRHVYINGTDPLGWSTDTLTGIVTMGSPPPNGAIMTADFSYYFRCRFTEDNQEFENFLVGYWKVGQLKFESVLP